MLRCLPVFVHWVSITLSLPESGDVLILLQISLILAIKGLQ